jgi:hypothetical protein
MIKAAPCSKFNERKLGGTFARLDDSQNIEISVLIPPPFSSPRLRRIQNGHANRFFSFVSEEDALVLQKLGLGGLLGALQVDVEDSFEARYHVYGFRNPGSSMA